MRKRIPLALHIYHHSKALLFSVLSVALILAAPTFVKSDALKMNMPGLMLSIQTPSVIAEAIGPELEQPNPHDDIIQSPPTEHSTQTPAPQQPQPRKAERQKPVLPEGFTPAWEAVSLDKHQIQLEMLKKGFSLKQTWRQAGSEYFTYGAYLFDEVAVGIKDPDLARQLKLLSVLAETMGHSVRQASSLRYDGAPSTDMAHLQVRSAILFQLDSLHKGSLKMVDLDQNGKPVVVGGTKTEEQEMAGETLEAFVKTKQRILQSPLGKQYPQTMALIEKQGVLLEQLARHMETRWESTFYCPNRGQVPCNGNITYMRIFAHQSLPSEKISVPDSRISFYKPGKKG